MGVTSQKHRFTFIFWALKPFYLQYYAVLWWQRLIFFPVVRRLWDRAARRHGFLKAVTRLVSSHSKKTMQFFIRPGCVPSYPQLQHCAAAGGQNNRTDMQCMLAESCKEDKSVNEYIDKESGFFFLLLLITSCSNTSTSFEVISLKSK